MMVKRTPKDSFRFIVDEPQDGEGGGYFDFYHKKVAPALIDILKSDTTPHTIGIFGSWGTGKSTIIKLIEKDIHPDVPVFMFDAWKYQDDALRRTFLIKFKEFLEGNGVSFPENYLLEIYSSTQNSETVQESTSAKKLSQGERIKQWVSRNKFLLILLFLFTVATLSNHFFPNLQLVETLTSIISTLAGFTALVIFTKPFVEKALSNMATSLLDTKSDASQLNTFITSKEKLNSPELFEAKFKDMLIKLGDKKVVVVFDNIDRVQGDVAIGMLSTIKTFMEPNNDSKVVFLIPCDAEAIDEQVKQFYGKDNQTLGNRSSSDYLRKVFNLILWLPDYVATDLEEYADKLIEQTGSMSIYLKNPQVIMVINSAFAKNPRDIIQFINNLIALIITVKKTNVESVVLQNVPYLAKVQVLKQKFPDGYKRLQEKWNEPENIVLPNSELLEERELLEFMRLTNRITTQDVQPFIYFKDPLDVRGLSRSNELLEALTSGEGDIINELIEAENNPEAISKFVLDVLKKYSTLSDVVTKIFNNQFSEISKIVPDSFRSTYFNELILLVDAQLWAYNDKLDLDAILQVLNDENVDSDISKTILERYVEEAKLSGSIDDINIDSAKRLIGAIASHGHIFSAKQLEQVKSSLDSNPELFGELVSVFDTKALQDTFVTESAFDGFFSKYAAKNVIARLEYLTTYKDYVIGRSNLTNVLQNYLSSLQAEYDRDPGMPANIIPFGKGLGKIVMTFRDLLKTPENASVLNGVYNVFYNSYSYASEAEKAKMLVGFYWLHGYGTSYDENILSYVNSYLSSTNIDNVKEFVGYWDGSTKNRLVRLTKDYLLPRILNDLDLLKYLYGFADIASKRLIHQLIFSSNPSPEVFDFILPDVSEDNIIAVTSGLLSKVQANRNINSNEEKILLSNLNLKTHREAKDSALKVLDVLISTPDDANVVALSRIIAGGRFFAITDKRDIARKLLEMFGLMSFTVDKEIAQLVKFVVAQLSKSPIDRKLVVNRILRLLPKAVDADTAKSFADSLHDIKPNKKAYGDELTQAKQLVEARSDGEVKDILLKLF